MLLQIVTFVLVLGFLVFIHELGHFITARKTGTKAEEFGMGLPPRIFGVRRKAENPRKWEWVGPKAKSEDTKYTIYSLNWLPIGGFLKIKGENEGDLGPDSFGGKSAGQRTLMLSAGVIMNFLAAIFILALAFYIGFPSVLDENTDASHVRERQVQIATILENSPAQAAELQPDDILVSINGRQPTTIDEVQGIVSQNVDQPLAVVVQRGDETVASNITPTYLEETQSPALGVGLLEIGTVSYPPHVALWRGVTGTGYVTVEIFKVIGRLVSSVFTETKVQEQIAGPVGIYRLTGQFVDLGFFFILQFAALLSINLAIINILPFPALDGGRILFVIIEKLRGGRAVSRKIENLIHTIGFVILILLIIYVTVIDFSRVGTELLGTVKGIF